MSMRIVALTCLVALVPATGIAANSGKKTLTSYASDSELVEALKRWRESSLRSRRIVAEAAPSSQDVLPAPAAASSIPQAPNLDSSRLDAVEVTGSRIDPSDLASITNNQSLGVDEGDIVKVSGEHLIVLRRGRLFSIRIGNDRLQTVSAVDAYAPGVDPDDTWYDEMLVADDRIVVIGYSYDRGGTEIGVFDLTAEGQLRYRDTYQMRSNDYYSANNYASRLIGRKLIFYTPLNIDQDKIETLAFMPAVRHWHRAATPAEFKRILPATRIYRSGKELDPDEDVVLHSVSVCDLDNPALDCRSSAVLGPEGRVFYVSRDAVYVWTTPWSLDPKEPNSSAVFRMPLDGAAPSGLRVSGSPIDQMSFLERDGYLNVLVGSEADGEGMWASASKAGDLALFRVRLDDLGDGNGIAASSAYRALPSIGDDYDGMQGRFIGDWLVYGISEPWHRNRPLPIAHALKYAGNDAVTALHPGHYVDRIDALGGDAILVGSRDDDLYFTSLRLDTKPGLYSQYIQAYAEQGDDRTHGFFYKADGEGVGTAGLPIMRFGERSKDATGAAVLYLRNRGLRLSRMGTLDSRANAGIDDGCKASCVDWYGNARPIFIGKRVFALLGYELVEGTQTDDRITERRRVNFAPRKPSPPKNP